METAVKQGLDFGRIKAAVEQQWETMRHLPLFRVRATGEELWAAYLAAFPPGTNPTFRKRTEHDCGCCRHFVRDLGGAVAVTDGGVVTTLWDRVPAGEHGYGEVAAAMAALVRSRPVESPLLLSEPQVGTDKSFEAAEGGRAVSWRHFCARIPPALVARRADVAATLSEKRAVRDVLERGLRELDPAALEQFLDLVAQGSLYRGEEHAGAVRKFAALMAEWRAAPEARRDALAWLIAWRESPALCRLRNTAAGSLLVDLSEGKGLEESVAAYEQKVAPQNYRRPKALVTKRMVDDAKAAVAGLGLLGALDRRHAVLSDVSVRDVLFADRGARRALSGDAFSEVAAEARDRAPDLSRVEDVPADRFVAEVLPRAQTLEALFENRHLPNLVTLVAPCDPGAGLLFRWPNAFSWSYAGEVADSIRERVKRAGGSVEGDLLCRLAWRNHDDLDLHMLEPGGAEWSDRHHISFANKGPSASGGRLDVDMNAGGGHTREPVENIFYPSAAKMRPGVYVLFVHQFCNRDKSDTGFEVQVEVLGKTYGGAWERSPAQGAKVEVARLLVGKGGEVELATEMRESRASRKAWGLDTERFHRCHVAMLSPNYWGGEAHGNRHLFLMLDGCASDAPARGFYNEFLNPALDRHRKVLELVGSKARPAPAAEQLSGLGFSSTQRNSVVVRVGGAVNRTLRVQF